MSFSNLVILSQPLSAEQVRIGELLSSPVFPASKAVSVSYESRDYEMKERYTRSGEVAYKSLKYPFKTFQAICKDPMRSAQLQAAALRRQPLYFVVGFQELGDTASHKPPTNVRRDSTMDMEEAVAPNTYGLEIREVQCRIARPDEPHSIEDINWKWTYHPLPSNDAYDHLQLEIGLGGSVNLEELRML